MNASAHVPTTKTDRRPCEGNFTSYPLGEKDGAHTAEEVWPILDDASADAPYNATGHAWPGSPEGIARHILVIGTIMAVAALMVTSGLGIGV